MNEYKIAKFGSNNLTDTIYAQSCFGHVRIALLIVQHLYPGVLGWFDNKVLPELLRHDGRRQLIALLTPQKHELIGFCILKCTQAERKICTLMVLPEYQGCGYGGYLFELSFQALGTRKPSLTISSSSLPAFAPYIKKYEFVQHGVSYERYIKHVNEYVYN